MFFSKRINIILIIFLILGSNQSAHSVDAIVFVYSGHVKWTEYNFNSDTDCGDGHMNTCENRMRIYATSVSSCTSKTWRSTSYVNTYPTVTLYPSKEISWSSSGSVPCLTFSVKIQEDSGSYSTSTVTLTIPSDYSSPSTTLDLVLGTANGYFKITYWLTIDTYF